MKLAGEGMDRSFRQPRYAALKRMAIPGIRGQAVALDCPSGHCELIHSAFGGVSLWLTPSSAEHRIPSKARTGQALEAQVVDYIVASARLDGLASALNPFQTRSSR